MQESCLKNRKFIAFCIDEAQHIFKGIRPDKFLHQFDIVKTLVEKTQVDHILFGVYDLINLIHISGQMTNRTKVVHFSRYMPENITYFQEALSALRNVLPIESDIFEDIYLEYCYNQTIGCVGSLSKWLTTSLNTALRAGDKQLTIHHLKQHALSKRDVATLLAEAQRNEKKVEALLEKADFNDFDNNIRQGAISIENLKSDNARVHSKHTPFQRTPTRDETGGYFKRNTGTDKE